jgi:hypothetical protein
MTKRTMIASAKRLSLWKASSNSSPAIMRRYNINFQKAVWVSSRDAEEELGWHSNHHNIVLWFRELQHHGFIVKAKSNHRNPQWRSLSGEPKHGAMLSILWEEDAPSAALPHRLAIARVRRGRRVGLLTDVVPIKYSKFMESVSTYDCIGPPRRSSTLRGRISSPRAALLR